MQELLTYITQHIVTHPDSVVVTETPSEEDQITLHMSVHPDDMGLVIGREGNTARALRNVMRIAAAKQHQRIYLDIQDGAAEQATA